MNPLTACFLSALIIGMTATLVMDIWSALRQRTFAIAAPNYGLVGRWILHMRHGQFRHDAISRSAPIAGETLVGWLAHYLIGIAFAGLLLVVAGTGWIGHPTARPPILIGLATVAAPFLLMQPGMGAGIAASRTPAPNKARLQSLLNHGVFGVGLYIGGWITHVIMY